MTGGTGDSGEFAELDGQHAYELLGVSPGASDAEVQRAYRGLAKTCHPDAVTGGPEAKERARRRFALITAARDILIRHRAAYDAFRDAPATGPAFTEDAAWSPEDPWDTENPWDTEDPWYVAEPGAPPDPWDTAEPGTAPPDPWDTATPGAPPAGPTPPQPPPPPRPRPPPYRPPPRPMGFSFGAKLGMGCVTTFALMLFIFGMVLLASATLVSPAEPEPRVSVPERFAGTWTGTVKGKDEDAERGKAEITLRAGRNNGRVRYLDGECTGLAVPVSNAGGRLVLNTEFSEDESGCDTGDMHLTRRKDGRLSLTYRAGADKVIQSGVLRRVRATPAP
jgi:hypothetical protein